MVDVFKSLKDPALSLMNAKMTVYSRDEFTDENGFIREGYLVKDKDIPCRLSFESSRYNQDDKTSSSDVFMRLFTPFDCELSVGTRVLVSQNGVSYFLSVSKIFAYCSHREYTVKEVEKWL